MKRARFTQLTDATAEDFARIRAADAATAAGLPQRMMSHLQLLRALPCGHVVDQFEHSLQTATRAFRDGRDNEYVVCALLHDVGDVLAVHNHAEFAAMLLQPFVREELHWMVKYHPVFQEFHYGEVIGIDPHRREVFADHPHYAITLEFSERYDRSSFDPAYQSLPLEFFEPMVEEVFSSRAGRRSNDRQQHDIRLLD